MAGSRKVRFSWPNVISKVISSLGLKVIQSGISFAVIHELVSSWGPSRYGIWVTMTSVIAFSSVFDLGVGYGIKNRIAEAVGVGRLWTAETAARFGWLFYAAAAGVILAVGVPVIDNFPPFNEQRGIATILWIGFALNFLLSYSNTILQAFGRFTIVNGAALISPTLWLLFLKAFDTGRSVSPASSALVFVALLLLQGLVATLLAHRIWPFRLFADMRESWRVGRSAVRVGARFFLLQMTSMLLYYSGNYLAYRHLGAAQVARYDAGNKTFAIFSLGFSVVVSVAWVEISKSKALQDGRRLTQLFVGLHSLALLTMLGAAVVAAFAPLITNFLTHITLTPSEALPFAVLVSLQSLAFCSAVYLNAFERFRVQIAMSLLSIPIFFACTELLFRLGYGITTMPWALTVTLVPAIAVYFPVARKMIAAHSAHRPRIWSRKRPRQVDHHAQ